MTPTPTPANDNRPQWFDDLLIKYTPYLLGQCARKVGESNAEDLMQDVRLLAMKRWRRYRRDGGFLAWLGYLVLDVQREKAHGLVPTLTIDDGHDVATPAPQEHAVDIELALRPCTARERKIILMYGQGFVCREIGEAMGMSRVWAMKILHDGLDVVRTAANDNVKQDKKAA